MSKKVTEPRVNTTIRLPKSLHKKLDDYVKKNHRSISEQVAYWIDTTVKALALVMLLTSCDVDQTIEYTIDPELKPIVDSFYADAEANGMLLDRQNLIVGYGITDSDVGGVSSEMGSQRTIIINQRYQGHSDLKWIVYHELGHAVLRRKHKAGETSIMSPVLWNNGNLSQSLIKELFSESDYR